MHKKDSIELYKRQGGIIDNELLASTKIHILGTGGIGSWSALLLGKMGVGEINLYDNDKVELHNTSSQFFENKDIDTYKVQALKKNMRKQVSDDVSIYAYMQNEEKNIYDGIVIVAVDSLQARRNICEKLKDKDVKIIDGRMGGLQLEIYNSIPSEYLNTIGSDEDVESEPCTERSISFNCAIIGGLIANNVRRIITDSDIENNVIMGFNSPISFIQQ